MSIYKGKGGNLNEILLVIFRCSNYLVIPRSIIHLSP